MADNNNPLKRKPEIKKPIAYRPGEKSAKKDMFAKMSSNTDSMLFDWANSNKIRGSKSKLSDVAGGKFFTGAARSVDEKTIKGENQHWAGKLANGLVGNTLGVATKVGRGLSELLGLSYDLSQAQSNPYMKAVNKELYGTSTPHMYENIFTEFMDKAENEWIKEDLLPVHGGDSYYSDNLWKKMGDMKFWSDDLADGVAFAVSAYAPSLAITKAVQAAKLTGAAAKAVSTSLLTGYNTMTEAALEGSETKKAVREELAYKNYNTSFDNLTKAQQFELNKKGAEYAANTFRANAGLLIGSNLVQARFFLGPVKKTGKNMVKAIRDGSLKASDIKVGQRALKQMGIGVVSEGLWEEGLQSAIQRYEESRATGEAYAPRGLGYAYEWLDNWTNIEGQQSMLMGALIGMGMGSISSINQSREEKRFISDYDKKYQGALKEFEKYEKMFPDDIKHFYKTFKHEYKDDEGITKTATSLFNEEGNSEIDLDKVYKMYLSNMADKTRMTELAGAALNFDPVHEEFILTEAAGALFNRYYSQGIFEDPQDALETILEKENLNKLAEDEELKREGYDFDRIKQKLAEAAEAYEEVHDKMPESKEDVTDDKTVQRFKNMSKKAAYGLNLKIKTLNNIRDHVDESKHEEIDAMIEQAEETRDSLYDKGERDKIFKGLKDVLKSREELHDNLVKKLEEDPGSLDASLLAYQIAENREINGSFNRNTIESMVLEPQDKTQSFAARNAFYERLGGDAIVSARAEAMLERVEKGNASLLDLVNIMANPHEGLVGVRGKQVVTEKDLQMVESVIPKAEKHIDENGFSEEAYKAESDKIAEASMLPAEAGGISSEEAQSMRKALEEKRNQTLQARNEFNQAIEKLRTLKAENGPKLFRDKTKYAREEKEEMNFFRDYADKVVDTANNILSVFNSNKDSYDNLPAVKKAIEQLKRYKKLYTETELKERLKNKAFDGYIQSIDKALGQLEGDLLEKTEENYKESSDRDRKHQRNKNKKAFSSLGLSVNESGEVAVIDEDINSAVREYIGEEEYQKLINDAIGAQELGTEYIFHEVFVERAYNLIEKSGNKNEFIALLEKKKKEYQDRVEKQMSVPKGITSKYIKNLMAKYVINPSMAFEAYIKRNIGIKKNNEKDAVDVFYKNKDVHEFSDALETIEELNYDSEFTVEELRSIAKAHTRAMAINDSLERMKSDYNHTLELQREEQHHTENKVAPTNQQISAIRGAVKWAKRKIASPKGEKKTEHRFKNWFFLRGIAGSGKTQVVIKYLMDVMRVDPSKIYAIAPHSSAKVMLGNSINSKNDVTLVDEVSPENIPDGVEFIVIDEVAAIEPGAITVLAEKLQKANEGRKTPLRIIALGDPSQIQKETANQPESYDPAISSIDITGTEYIYHGDPLTINHRSLIPELNEIVDIFQDNFNAVTGFEAIANGAIGQTSLGVHVGDREQLLQQLKATKDNGRTKAVIVTTQAEKKRYEGYDVYTYDEVAGREFDEAYVDLNRSAFKNDKIYNKAMYTAASRAKQYVYFNLPGENFKQKIENSLKQDTTSRKELNDERAKEYEKRLAFEKEVIRGSDDFLNLEKKEKEEARKPDEEDSIYEDNYQEDTSDDNTGKEEPESTGQVESVIGNSSRARGLHNLKFPSFLGTKLFGKKGPSATLKKDAKVYYIKARDPKTNQMQIHVIGQLSDVDGKPMDRFAHLGIVGGTEFESDFGVELFTNASEKAVDKDGVPLFNIVTIEDGVAKLEHDLFSDEETDKEMFEKTTLATGRLDAARPLTYTYSDKVTYRGSGMINKLKDIFNQKYLKRGDEKAKYSVRIYSKTDAPAKRLAGVPYLIIEPTSKNGKIKSPQFIRLNPRGIRKDDEIIKDIKRWQDNIAKLEEITGGKYGTPEFNNIVYAFKDNYHIVDGNVEFKDKNLTFKDYQEGVKSGKYIALSKKQFNEVTKSIHGVIEGFYGAGEVRVVLEDEAEMISKYGLDDLMEDDNSRYEFVPYKKRSGGYVKTYDKANKESKGKILFENGLKAGRGYAQRQFNVLAKANDRINGKGIRVRVKADKVYRGMRRSYDKYSSQGVSLLTTDEHLDQYLLHLKNLAKEHKVLTKRYNEDGSLRQVDQFVDEESVSVYEDYFVENGIKTREELKNLREKHIKVEPITMETLNEITSFEGDESSTMRRPLEMNYINNLGENLNKENVEKLEEYLVTNLSDIESTEVSVKLDSETDTKRYGKEEKTEPKESEKGNVGAKITDVSKKLFGKKGPKGMSSIGTVLLGKKISQDKARKNIKKMFPGITDEEIKFVDKRMVDFMLNKKGWGVFKDGVIYMAKNKDGSVYENIARHEVGHKIWNEMFTPEQRAEYQVLFEKRFGSDLIQKYGSIEEAFVVKYHEYHRGLLGKVADEIKEIFDKIGKFLGLWATNINKVEDVFRKMERGMYDYKNAKSDTITRGMYDIQKNYGSVTNYLLARNATLSLFKEFRDNGKNGVPLTKQEIMSEVKKTLQSHRDDQYKEDNTSIEAKTVISLYDTTIDNIGDVLNDIFPGFNPYKEELYIENVMDETDRWDAEVDKVNLKHHIIENSMVNLEASLTDDIKEWLSYIEDEDGSFISYRYVYPKLLSLFEGIDFHNDNVIELIEDALGSQDLNSKEKAILRKIKELEGLIYYDQSNGRVIPKNSKFVNQDLFVYTALKNADISDINHEHDSRLADETVVIVKRGSKSSEEFFEEIAKVSGLDNNSLFVLYKQTESNRLWNGMVSMMNSQRNRNSMIGIRKRGRGATNDIKYINARGNTTINSIESAVRSALMNKVKTPEDHKKFATMVALADADARSDDMKFVKKILNDLGLYGFSSDLRNKDVKTIREDLLGFVSRSKDKLGKVLKEQEDISFDVMDPHYVDNTYTMGMLIDDYGHSFIRHLAKEISTLDSLMRTYNSKDAKGNRRYNSVLTSQAHKNLYALSSKNQKGKKNLKANKKFSNSFWKKNIFVNGRNKINQIIDDDGNYSVTINGRRISTAYSDEHRREFNYRTFMLGFISNVKASRASKPRYIQYTQPTERKTAFGAEVYVSDKKTLIGSIEMIIEQLSNRNVENESKYEFYDVNSNLGFEVLQEVIGDREISTIRKREIPAIANKVYDRLMEKSKEYAKVLIEDKVEVDNQLSTLNHFDAFIDKDEYSGYKASSIPNRNNLTRTYQTWEEAALANGYPKGTKSTVLRNKGIQREYVLKEEDIAPLASLFYINNYVNGFALNQLFSGDPAIFKNEKNMTKRAGISTAPARRGKIGRKGMKETSRVAVFEDPRGEINDIERFLKRLLPESDVKEVLDLFPESYEPGDGQGFMLPERMGDINYGFGANYKNVIKPVYYHIDEEGVSVAFKFSSVVLSDELVSKYPKLGVLRDKMRAKAVDEVIFNTGVKSGNPKVKNDWDLITTNEETNIEEESVLTISNEDYGIQLDPNTKLESSVKNPIQLSYLMKLFSNNKDQAKKVYGAMSSIINLNRSNLKASVDKRGFEAFVKKVVKKKGSEQVSHLIDSGINHQFPSISDRVVTQLLSSVHNRAIDIRHQGTKLVLQSPLGMEKVFDDKGISKDDLPSRKLTFKEDNNGNMYAECMLPKGILTKDEEKQIEDNLDKGVEPVSVYPMNSELLGFRIPASDLHSAVPLKVVGFYDSQGTSVIIAPEELVPIHGSDFDVDSLFVIKRQVNTLYKEGRVPVGYDKVDGKYVFSDDITRILLPNPENIKSIDRDNRRLKEEFYKNQIIESYLEAISNPSNRKRMLSPISLKELHQEKQRIMDMTHQSEVNYHVNDIMHSQKVHETMYSGDTAIGMFMNMFKVFSFMQNSGKGNTMPSFREYGDGKRHSLVFDGVSYDVFRDTDVNGKTISYRFDSIANAALDDLNEQILPYINVNPDTVKAYSVMLMHGISSEVIHDFMVQPIMKYVTRKGKMNVSDVIGTIENLNLFAEDELNSLDINTAQLKEFIKSGLKIEEVLKKDEYTADDIQFIKEQYKVYKVYQNMTNVGDSLSKMAKVINLVSDMPVDKYELDEVLSIVHNMLGYEKSVFDKVNMDNSSFPYDIANFIESNSHIGEALKVVEWASHTVERNFIKYSKEIKGIINDVKSITGIHLSYDSDAANTKAFTEEFQKYIAASLFDQEDIPPYKVFNVNMKEVSYTGAEAFNQHFIDIVEKAKNDDISKIKEGKRKGESYKGNQFLAALQIQTDYFTNTRSLVFGGPSSMTVEDINMFMEDFIALNMYKQELKNGSFSLQEIEIGERTGYTNFQQMFVDYALINNGMSFGLNNYSYVMPPDLYKEQSDDFVKKLYRIKNMSELEKENLAKAFSMELALNNPDTITMMTISPISQGKVEEDGKTKNVYHGVSLEGIHYDRMYKRETEEEWSELIREEWGDNITVYKRIGAGKSKTAHYVKLGTKKQISYYRGMSIDLASSTDVNENIASREKHVKVHDINTTKIRNKFKKLKVGEVITVSNYDDPGRVDKRYARVVEELDNGYKIEYQDEIESYGMISEPGGKAQQVKKEIEKILKKKGGPFVGKKGGHIVFKRNREGEGRQLRHQINNEFFQGNKVLVETVSPFGWEVLVDEKALADYLYGQQLSIYGASPNISTDSNSNFGLRIEAIKRELEDVLNPLTGTLGVVDPLIAKEKYDEYDQTYSDKSSLQILEEIADRTKSPFLKSTIKWMQNRFSEWAPTVLGSRNLNGFTSKYFSDGSIAFDYNNLAALGITIEESDRIFVHEMIHAATVHAMNNDVRFNHRLYGVAMDVMQSNPELVEKYKYVFETAKQEGKMQYEFVAELLSNKEFYDDVSEATKNMEFDQKKKGLLRYIIDSILDFFGVKRKSGYVDSLVRYINQNVSTASGFREASSFESDITMSEYGYRSYDQSTHIKTLVEESDTIRVEEDEEGVEGEFYEGVDGTKFGRVSDIYKGFISLFRKNVKERTKTWGEQKADREWQNTPKDKPKRTDTSEFESYDDYKKRMDEQLLMTQARGRIVHKFIQRWTDRMFNYGRNEGRINAEIQQLAYGNHNIVYHNEDGTTTEHTIKLSIDPEKFSWVDEKIGGILKAHDINIAETTESDLRDIIASEITVSNEILGYAGTADLVIEHHDGTLSVKDIKTGTRFDQYISNKVLKYGKQDRDITDSGRDRAKLQIIMYALMIKAERPDVKFRDLSVMWIPNKYQAENIDANRRVDVGNYLSMIESFLKDKEELKKAGLPEDAYEKLIEKSPNLFNSSHYSYRYDPKPGEYEKSNNDSDYEADLEAELIDTDKSAQEILDLKIAELTKIIGKAPVDIKYGKNKFEDLSRRDQIKARMLAYQIVQMQADPSMELTLNPDSEVTGMSGWIGNYSELKVPHIKVWKQFRDKQNKKAIDRHYYLMRQFKALNKRVLDEYYRDNPSMFRNKRHLNRLNYQKLYQWAYKEFDDNGATNVRLITPEDEEFKNGTLTEAQKELLVFMSDVYKGYFVGNDAYLNQPYINKTHFGKEISLTALELHNLELAEGSKRKYYNGWFPKIPKDRSEIIFEAGNGNYMRGLVQGEFVKSMLHRGLTRHIENEYQGRNQKTMVLPLKYLGSTAIDNGRNYSLNLEFQFDGFVRSIEYKKNMDPVYALGESIRGMLAMYKYKDTSVFNNTLNIFDKRLTADVLNRTIQDNITSTKIRMPAFMGSRYEDEPIRIEGLFYAAKNWVSATTMWIRPFQGVGNGIHANILKHKEGLKGTIAGNVFNVNQDSIDYTLKDSLWAESEYMNFAKDSMTGDLEKNKLWIMMREFEYLPDNFDFKSSTKYLDTVRNRILGNDSKYGFHRIPEEFVSMTTLAAQMRHLKHPTIKDANGKPKSLYDCYEVVQDEGGQYHLKWTGGVRGYMQKSSAEGVSYEKMEGLTSQEIAKLKKVYERMQGGYRKEELATLEVYVVGKLFVQLKRYLGRLLLNAVHSKRSEMDLGKYKKIEGEIHEGEDVYEWMQRNTEGRWRTVINSVLAMARLGSSEYRWKNLSGEQKQNIIDAMATLSLWAASYAAYIAMFEDEPDDDTLKKFWKMYLIDNLGQQYNPVEFGRLLSQYVQPVALSRGIKTMEGFSKMLIAGYNLTLGDPDKAYTDQDDLKGWYQFRKSIPYLSSYSDFLNRVGKTRRLEDTYFGDLTHKWR